MKYIGNYSSWVDDDWIHKAIYNIGQARPRDWPPSSDIECIEYLKYESAGYDLKAVNWWVYEQKDLDISIDPPWTSKKIHWWITKLNPGQFMPMHTDPHTHGENCNRYWVPLQDYVPGHVFLYGESFVADYKKGDVFRYIDPTAIHGAANISHSVRLVLQITEYDI